MLMQPAMPRQPAITERVRHYRGRPPSPLQFQPHPYKEGYRELHTAAGQSPWQQGRDHGNRAEPMAIGRSPRQLMIATTGRQ